MSYNDIRSRCMEILISLTDEKYGTELEKQINHRSNRPKTADALMTTYYRHYNRVLSALRMDSKLITSKYSPSQLILATLNNLSETLNLKDIRKEFMEKHEIYQQILNGNGVDGDDEDDDDVELRGISCVCGNKKRFRVKLVQTRSGDEAMTQFFTCVKCGARFKK